MSLPLTKIINTFVKLDVIKLFDNVKKKNDRRNDTVYLSKELILNDSSNTFHST